MAALRLLALISRYVSLLLIRHDIVAAVTDDAIRRCLLRACYARVLMPPTACRRLMFFCRHLRRCAMPHCRFICYALLHTLLMRSAKICARARKILRLLPLRHSYAVYGAALMMRVMLTLITLLHARC